MKLTRSQMVDKVGQEIGLSRWFVVSQDRINLFADVTEDDQFIHVDPDRAAHGPFGGTIAHGFLTLSLLSPMAGDAVPEIEGVTSSINYGFDRIRFVSPVHSEARIRGRFMLIKFAEVSPGVVSSEVEVTVEIEGQDKPALVATWLARRNFH